MIHFMLSIINSHAKDGGFKTVFDRSATVSTNKFVELQAYRGSSEIFQIKLTTVWRGRDHAGPEIELTLFGWGIILSLLDKRHWDYDNNCWGKYGN